MLKACEIEKLIKSDEPLPERSDSFEKFYYHALSIGVELYRQGKISRDSLRNYTIEYRNIYNDIVLWLEILKRHRKLEMTISRAELGECEYCKAILKYLDGREHIE